MSLWKQLALDTDRAVTLVGGGGGAGQPHGQTKGRPTSATPGFISASVF